MELLNGKPVLLDANPTIGIASRTNPSPHIRYLVEKLAPGLHAFLPPRTFTSPEPLNLDARSR
jgi:hypothetical protein